MSSLLVATILLLAFPDEANDNFNGVDTLWGTARYSYHSVLGWATVCTFAGSLLSGGLSGLAGGFSKVFNGSASWERSVSMWLVRATPLIQLEPFGDLHQKIST